MIHPFFCGGGVKGTTVNYFLDDKINKAEILFPGVACFLIAAFLGSIVHSSNMADNDLKLKSSPANFEEPKYVLVLFFYDSCFGRHFLV